MYILYIYILYIKDVLYLRWNKHHLSAYFASLPYWPCHENMLMATATNAGNLQQYKSRMSLIVEQILVFASSTNLVRGVKNLPPNFR